MTISGYYLIHCYISTDFKSVFVYYGQSAASVDSAKGFTSFQSRKLPVRVAKLLYLNYFPYSFTTSL